MNGEAIGAIAAVVGASSVMSYVQLRRGQAGWMPLAAFAFFAWRLALTFQWWTIGLIFAAGLIAGGLNGFWMRRHGRAAMLDMSATVGVIAIVAGAVVLGFHVF